ncbi:MAG: acyl-CoA desaturase [Bacteroidia bacterium]|nr:acyl-CoA desaturase [Bacteroidia bacterium]
MQAIKFKTSNTTENDFAAELKKNVQDYFIKNNISTKANTAMVFKTIIMVSLYVVPFIVLLTVPMNLWWGALVAVIMGIGIAGTGMGVMHDACHGAYSSKPWVNNLLGGSLYLLGSNVLNWKIQHNVLHHTYTNLTGMDEDIDAKGPIRLSSGTPLRKYHKYQFLYAFFFYGFMTTSKLINDFTNLYRYNKEGFVKQLKVDILKEYPKMVIRKIIYLVAIFGLPLWFTDFTWYQILAGFFIMHWVASMILSFVFQMAHVVEGADQPELDHAGDTNWYVHQLKTTSDFARNNRILSWYVGGLNYQIEHHLFQNICHIHYKKIAPIVQNLAKKYGIEYNLKPSFRNALASHMVMLKYYGQH